MENDYDDDANCQLCQTNVLRQKPTSVQYALWSISSISAISGGISFTISCRKFIIHGVLGSTGVIAFYVSKKQNIYIYIYAFGRLVTIKAV